MKKLLSLFLLLCLASCLNTAEENFESLKKIRVGMSYESANALMANAPKDIETAFWNESLFVQYYESPANASDDYAIVFTKKDSTVVEIKFGD